MTMHPSAALFLDAVKADDAPRLAALLREDPALVSLALEHGKTGLHWAAEVDAPGAARTLLDAGADLEARTSWGASPLDWSAVVGSARVAELLLARGAGGLGLLGAAALGRLDEVRAAVEAGGDLTAHRRHDAPDAPDDHWPPDCAHLQGDVLSDALYSAARNGHDAVVTYLLERGAQVDARGVFGGTGLHWAALHGHASTVELLLARGADPTRQDDRFGATPEGWAREGGHDALAEVLRRRRRGR